jgi:hypothetical protein
VYLDGSMPRTAHGVGGVIGQRRRQAGLGAHRKGADAVVGRGVSSAVNGCELIVGCTRAIAAEQ